MNDHANFDPSAVPPADDFAADPAAATRTRRLAAARRLLRGLPNRAAADRAAAFTVGALRAAALLFLHDQPAYQRLKAELRRQPGLIRDFEREVHKVRKKAHAHDGQSAYSEGASGLIWHKTTLDGDTVEVPLTNFTGRVVGLVTRDDGAETTQFYCVEIAFRDVPCHLEVPAAEFDAMRWTHMLPLNAYVLPNQERRAAVALRELSQSYVESRTYAHTGWRPIGDQHVYLSAGCSIGALGAIAGVDTALESHSARYDLPEPPEGEALAAAKAASERFLDLAPLRITAPMLAAVPRSVLSGADFSLYASGRTGYYKSEVAALVQQHFGPTLTARNLVSFESTANHLEVVSRSWWRLGGARSEVAWWGGSGGEVRVGG